MKEQTGKIEQQELIRALDQVFFSILLVKPFEETVLVLHSQDHPEWVGRELLWQPYLEGYGKILSQQGQETILKRLNSAALRTLCENNEGGMGVSVSYKKEQATNWLAISVQPKQQPDGTWHVYLFVRPANDEHLRQSIVDLYVYRNCDYFIYLDAAHNSYITFSLDADSPSKPPAVSDNYERDLEEYARTYVVPEDQEMVIREMGIERVLDDLEAYGIHTFTTGLNEPGLGYRRKQLTYLYYDRDAQTILLSRTDITGIYLEQQRQQEALEEARRQALHDSKTGLLNDKGIVEAVDKALEVEQSGALLFIDLDDFKKINDTLGHQKGDHLLRQVARVLRQQSHAKDLQGRVGGDEFIVFLRGVKSYEEIEKTAIQICTGIAYLADEDTSFSAVSASIGIAVAPTDGVSYAELMQVADRRSYRVKAKGKNGYLF